MKKIMSVIVLLSVLVFLQTGCWKKDSSKTDADSANSVIYEEESAPEAAPEVLDQEADLNQPSDANMGADTQMPADVDSEPAGQSEGSEEY